MHLSHITILLSMLACAFAAPPASSLDKRCDRLQCAWCRGIEVICGQSCEKVSPVRLVATLTASQWLIMDVKPLSAAQLQCKQRCLCTSQCAGVSLDSG